MSTGVAADDASSSGGNASAPLLRAALVFVLAAALLLPSLRIGAAFHDEGFVATGSMLVLHGKLPYRDFLSFYGPATYYVVAALFMALGEDLFVVRLYQALMLAGFVAALDALCRWRLGLSGRAAAAVAATAVGVALFAAPPAGYAAIPAAMLLAAVPLLAGFAVDARALRVASLLVAGAGLFRWDFGVFGLIALLAAMVWTRRQLPAPASFATLFRSAVVPFTAVMAAVYVPLIGIAAGPLRWLHEVLFYQLVEFPRYRALPMLLPSLEKLLRTSGSGDVIGIYEASLSLLFLVLPLLAVVGAAAYLSARDRAEDDAAGARIGATLAWLAVTTLLLLNQQRVRTTLVQGFPAVAMSLPLLAYGLRRLWRGWPKWRGLMGTAALCVAAALITVALRAELKPLRSYGAPLGPRAAFLSVDTTDYPMVLEYIRAHTQPGDRIYSGPPDHSKLFIADSLVYFLTDREPADPYMELEPGIANTEEGQERIREALEATRAPLVLLADLAHGEPNATSVSNGVHVLEEYLAERYREGARIGNYRVLLRRG